MEAKKSLSVLAALLAVGVAGPAAAIAADDAGSGPSVTAPAPGVDKGQSAADEQESGEQGDVENADLATEVQQADGADDQQGANDEQEVGDGVDGRVDDDEQGQADVKGQANDDEQGQADDAEAGDGADD